jgi:hypothetical protein
MNGFIMLDIFYENIKFNESEHSLYHSPIVSTIIENYMLLNIIYSIIIQRPSHGFPICKWRGFDFCFLHVSSTDARRPQQRDVTYFVPCSGLRPLGQNVLQLLLFVYAFRINGKSFISLIYNTFLFTFCILQHYM